jgi:hypothetical protein
MSSFSAMCCCLLTGGGAGGPGRPFSRDHGNNNQPNGENNDFSLDYLGARLMAIFGALLLGPGNATSPAVSKDGTFALPGATIAAAGLMARLFCNYKDVLFRLATSNIAKAGVLLHSSGSSHHQLKLILPAAILSMGAVLTTLMGPTAALATTAAAKPAKDGRNKALGVPMMPDDLILSNRPEVAAIFNIEPLQLEMLDVYRPTFAPEKQYNGPIPALGEITVGSLIHSGRNSSSGMAAAIRVPGERLASSQAAADGARGAAVQNSGAGTASGRQGSAGALGAAKGSCCITKEERALLEPKQCRTREWVYVR